MTIRQIQPPATEPVSLAEAKLFLRVEHDTDDTLISALITAARQAVEEFTGRALVTQGWELFVERPGRSLALARPPLQAVTAVEVVAADGTAVPVAEETYVVDSYSEPGRVLLRQGQCWPLMAGSLGLRVAFEAGYDDAAADVPAVYGQAMLLMVGHWYGQREAQEMPGEARVLLRPWRVIGI